MSRVLPSLMSGVILLAGAAGVRAQPGPEEPGVDQLNALTKLLPYQTGRKLCYVSSGVPVTFPLEDVKSRKKPRTLTMERFYFLLTSEQYGIDPTTSSSGKRYHAFRLLADVMDTKRKLIAAGDCGANDLRVFGCGVECDGGSVAFEPVTGKDELLMRVSSAAQRFRMTWGCGDGERDTVVLDYDGATPAVRLKKADLTACRPIAGAFKRFERRQ